MAASSEQTGHDMTTRRAMVERALYARAERLAEIDRRNHRRCYDCGGNRFMPFADGGLARCVNCQELLARSPGRVGRTRC